MGEAKRRRDAGNNRADPEQRRYFNLTTGVVDTARAAGVTARALINQALSRERRHLAGERVAADVPCGSCRACCYYAEVEVTPAQESPEALAHLDVVRNAKDNGWALRKKPDGSCVHLDDTGCSVRAHRPLACRHYDCRLYAMSGVLDSYSGGRVQPTWVFNSGSETDREFADAMMMGGAIHGKTTKGSAQEAFKAAVGNLDKHREVVRKAKAMFEGLDPYTKAQLTAELRERYRGINPAT